MTDFDFDRAFVSSASQEEGLEFETVNDAGERTGFFIRLAGPDSERRKRTRARLADFGLRIGASSAAAPRTRRERRAAASSSADKYTGAAALEYAELLLDDLVAATISWRFPPGTTGPECTPENVRRIYQQHPTLREQVAEIAESVDRFTRR